MMKTLFLLAALTSGAFATAQEPGRQIYVKTPTGFLMVLRQGEDVMIQLDAFVAKEKPPSATFTGMGFVNIKFGFFDFKKKVYEPKRIDAVELGSFNGSLAWADGKPSIHAHAVVAGKDFKAYAGHVLEAEVGTGSVEITILVHDKKLERKMDEKLGANVLELK